MAVILTYISVLCERPWLPVYTLFSCVEATNIPIGGLGGILYLEVSSLPPPRIFEQVLLVGSFYDWRSDERVRRIVYQKWNDVTDLIALYDLNTDKRIA